MVKSVKISVIIPVYNEEKRMGNFIEQLIDFSAKNLKSYEILFVDDGSKDKSVEVLTKLTKNHNNCMIISHKVNQGKGVAIKTGIDNAKGEKVVFIDADGSIQPEELPNMIKKLEKHKAVIGTRYSKKAEIKQPMSRKILAIVFNTYVNLLFGIRVKDSLCGFKGFETKIAKKLFKNLLSERWIFDVEILYKLRKMRIPVNAMPIKWVHKEGSKIKVFDPIKMAFNLISLRIKLIFHNA